ncbi:VanZ family protein [Cellulomonas sp.]|uniref:VanZ family protein n=1 Tax=Cellulomonas sp. TaxID=40001 RepID=UPI001B28EEB1|nr:VanZ family protein [Cellulomonas sp.]MBO9556700.1 VanZ family protein [Cellulomonas sp.]
MVQLWRSFSHLIPLVVVVGGVAFVAAAWVGWERAGSRRTWAAVRRACYDGAFAVWVVAVAVITLSPGAGAGLPGMEPSVRMVPFADLADLLTSSVHWEVPLVQIGGNLALFAAGGALTVLRGRSGVLRTASIYFAVRVVIESIQYVIGGRSAVVDDVILAGVGAGIGAAFVIVARRLTARGDRRAAVPQAAGAAAGAGVSDDD